MGFASFFSTAKFAAGFLAFLSALCPSSADAAYSGTGTFKKISASADVTDGYYVIGEAFANSYAMSDTYTTYFARSASAPVSNQYVNPPASIVWKIETNGSGKTIFSETQSKYVSYTGSSNSVQFVAAVSTDNQRWTVNFNASSQFELKNAAVTTRYLQYNSNTSQERFTCYTGTQKNLMLYKLDTTPTDKTSSPSFLPGAGTYNNSQSVALNCGTQNSTIYYTTDGSTPTNGSSVYSTPIAVTGDMTIKAFATSTGLADSDVSTADYSFKCATPTFNPVAGSFSKPQTVEITVGTSDTVIYYTTDNSTPSSASTQYSGPIALSATTTIKALATKPGYSDSDVAAGTFNITEAPAGFFEDFETMTGNGAYTGAEVTFATGKWQVYGYTTMDSNDRKVDNRSIRLRANSSDSNSNGIDGANMVQMNFDKPNGLGVVSFKYGSYSSHVGGSVYVQYSTDQGATWKERAAAVTASAWNGEMASASVTINVAGDARIRLIKKNQSNSMTLNVDNISITDFSGNNVPKGNSQQQVNVGDGRLVTIDFKNVVNAGPVTVSSSDIVEGDIPAKFRNAKELALEKYTFSTTATGWTADLNWTLKSDPPAGSDTAFRVVGGVVTPYPATIVGRNVTVTGVTGFSDWYVGTSTALPVALSGFELE